VEKETARKQKMTPSARKQALIERKRRKLEARERCGGGAVSSSDTKQHAQEEKPADTETASDVCAVCLSTEEESGKPVHWIFEACGHKCLCKHCLHKLKQKSGSKKGNSIECPLCRTFSKPVLAERFHGEVFGTGTDMF